MDRRKIQHVEAHLREVWQPRLDIAEFAVMADLRGGRTRKQFIPAAEGRALAIDDEFERRARAQSSIRIARHDGRARRIQRQRAGAA